ncbi:MAG: hypothetical protein LBK82_06515 [Planctomycetaceae bacterium]|nr:hypothetical protein [Planctomycetaceae bacterium]
MLLTPKRKATPFAIVNQVHCRRVRRRDLLANSERSPTSINRSPTSFNRRWNYRNIRSSGEPLAIR